MELSTYFIKKLCLRALLTKLFNENFKNNVPAYVVIFKILTIICIGQIIIWSIKKSCFGFSKVSEVLGRKSSQEQNDSADKDQEGELVTLD